VNQDRKVDSGLELCCKCSRMRGGRERGERGGREGGRKQYFILPHYVTGFPCDLTSVLGHSVVANLTRIDFLHIVRQTDKQMRELWKDLSLNVHYQPT